MPRVRAGRKSNLRRKGPKRAYRKGKSSPNTATSGSGQMARIVETIEFKDLTPNVTSQSVFNLSQFPRAATLAGNFAFYKATKVTWCYEPLYNTFQDAAGNASKPYLYTLMNRGQVNSITMGNLRNIQAAGAKPVALVSRKLITYKPNWCSPGMSVLQSSPNVAFASQGLKQQYSWLATSGQEIRDYSATSVPPVTVPIGNAAPITGVINPLDGTTFTTNFVNLPNSAVYNGHVNFIDQEVPGAEETPTCRLTCTVEWHFKGALFNQQFTAPPSTTVTEVK